MMQLTTGTISAVDATTCRVRVRLPECDNLRTHWLAVLQRNTQNNKDYWLPDINEQVKVLLDDSGTDGVVLGAIYSDIDRPIINDINKRRIDFSDGAFVEYDRKNHVMTLGGQINVIKVTTTANVIVETERATIKAEAITLDCANTTMTGDVQVNGNLSASGNVSGAQVSLKEHTHSNGNDGRPTGAPLS